MLRKLDYQSTHVGCLFHFIGTHRQKQILSTSHKNMLMLEICLLTWRWLGLINWASNPVQTRYSIKSTLMCVNLLNRVKSWNFGHQINSDTFANSGNPDEPAPYEPSHQDFHCLLSSLFFIPIIIIWIKQGRSPNLPDVRSYMYLALPYIIELCWVKSQLCSHPRLL